MLYHLMRSMVRLSLHFYCKRIGWEGLDNIPKGKPILFAITHSNSFLDALYIAASVEQGVYCLARGDAFRKPLANKILRHFKVLPIFRQSEQSANATLKNRKTFDECQELFRKNEWILIFPEGFCTHQTKVMPLKKGGNFPESWFGNGCSTSGKKRTPRHCNGSCTVRSCSV